jgi:hypothetical protein
MDKSQPNTGSVWVEHGCEAYRSSGVVGKALQFKPTTTKRRPTIMLLNSRKCIVITHIAFPRQGNMKLGGFLFLLSGWAIVLAALRLLHGGAVPGFVLAGLGVEILGLVLVARAHLPASEDKG